MALSQAEIIIVGCGPGAVEYLPPVGYKAIQHAEVLVGAPRMLDAFSLNGALKIPFGIDVSAMLEKMAGYAGFKNIVVLVTGDPGISSLARQVIERFGRANCRVIPGISAVQTAFARIALDWQGAFIVTAHGRTPSEEPSVFAGKKKIAVLTGGEATRSWLCSLAVALGNSHEIFICSNLTLSNERVDCISASELGTVPLPSRTIVLFIERGCLS
jgi:cobalt-precorrin-7 (C5)-methyltransferase